MFKRKLFLATLLAAIGFFGALPSADAAIQYSTTHRTNNVTDIVTQAGATAFLLIYTGAQPATCATAASGTLLVSMPMSATIGTVTSGVLTMNAITATATASAGTAGYWRITTTSAGTTVIAQGAVAVSSSDLNFAGGIIWTLGETISITSFTITANGALLIEAPRGFWIEEPVDMRKAA
jgi:hypothetical protein